MTDTSLDRERQRRAGSVMAWLTVGLAAWLIAGVALVTWALDQALVTDAGFSPFHIPGYFGLVALAVVCLALVVRAARRGIGWREAFPVGFGSLGAGLLAILGYVVVDVAWREGIGIEPGVEEGFVPSRILLVAGLVLVAAAPLRAALRAGGAASRWPATLSAGLVLGVLALPGALNPFANQWIEEPLDPLEDEVEVWLMDEDGSRQTRLVEAADGAEASLAAWSPDGRLLAYTRWTGDPETLDASVWVIAADGTGKHPLVDRDGWQWFPSWSPDGQWIAFTEEASGGPWMETGPDAPGAGGGLGPGFDPGAPAVRRDADILRIRADGSGSPEPLTDAPGDDRAPVYSPDGSRIVFDATRDGNTEIYVIGADGSGPRNLTNTPGEDWTPTWSPDGQRIAFNSDRSGEGQVHLMDADGSNVVQLTHEAGGSIWPSWSRDGSRIAFTSWRSGEAEVWSVAVDGSDPRNLSRSAGMNDQSWTGAYGPTGQMVFNRAGHLLAPSDPAIRNELSVAIALYHALLVALIAAVVARFGAPFGSFAVVLAVGALPSSMIYGQLRFVVAAAAAGLLVDVLVRLVDRGRRVRLAAALAAAASVVAPAGAVLATTQLGWTGPLLVGVTMAVAALGWAVGGLVGTAAAPGAPGVPAGDG